MSGYQYCEFRAQISATRFTSEYSSGNFRGNPGGCCRSTSTPACTRRAGDGDQRLLYLGWLLKVQLGELDEDLADEAEPPVPAGLRELSDSLDSVAQFLKIDDDLIAVAAKASAPLMSVSDDRIADWVTALSASEKDKFLTAVAEGEGAQVEALLVRRFRRESRPAGTTPASTGRTAGELLAAAEARRAAREQAEARAKEEVRARRAAESMSNLVSLTSTSALS